MAVRDAEPTTGREKLLADLNQAGPKGLSLADAQKSAGDGAEQRLISLTNKSVVVQADGRVYLSRHAPKE